MRRLPVLAATLLALTAAPAVTASAAAAIRVLVVSPSGSDSAAGTAAHPMRTIQLAVRRLRTGGTVELRGGTYHQRVALRRVQDVTIQPYGREHPTLSGQGLIAPAGLTAMVEIANSTDVTVRGLRITAYRTTRRGVVPAGIYVHGHDATVRIHGNHVFDLGNYNKTLGSFDINAHGIAVYGDDPHHSIHNLGIRGNTVEGLHLGASESVVVNGNVTGWSIVGNRIQDNNNIGIDAIGFEETLTGQYRYTQANRARHGTIADNTVARIRSRGNPAYWEDGQWCNCADGIYVDGGAYITISGNHVTGSDIGIEVAAENARGRADHVVTSHNTITGSLFTGITTGGYCNGAADCGGVRTGSSWDNTFEYNVLRGNNRLDDGSPELLVQYHVHNAVFAHNSITATNSGHVIYGTVPQADAGGNRSDQNRFHVAGGTAGTAEFGWHGHTYTGFAAYRAATGQDAHSTFGAFT